MSLNVLQREIRPDRFAGKCMPDITTAKATPGTSEWANRAYLMALRITKDPSLSEDVVQEVFTALARRKPVCANEGQWIVYLNKAVRHTAIRMVKRQQSIRQHEQADEQVADHPDRNKNASPADAAELSELIQAARTALGLLPEDERVAVSLCCEQGLTWEQASDVLQVPKQTLGYRLQKGLEALRARLLQAGFAVGATAALGEMMKGWALPQAPQSLATQIASLLGAEQALWTVKGAGGAAVVKSSAVLSWAVAATAAVTLTAGIVLAVKNAPEKAPAPPATVPAAAVTPPIPVPPRVLWFDRFENGSSWQTTDWKGADHLAWSLDKTTYQSAPGSLRIKYDFPRLVAASRDADEWVVNSRSLERPITIAASATHLRVWVRILAAEPKARLDIHLYNEKSEVWEADTLLDTTQKNWHMLEFELARLSGFWSKEQGHRVGDEIPKLAPERIVKLVLGGNNANFEALVDDLEFVEKKPSK